MKKLLFFAAAACGILLSAGENLLKNASFEDASPLVRKSWKMNGLSGWNLLLNSGFKKCEISLASPGRTGKHAIRLHTLGAAGFCAAVFRERIPVSPGTEVIASVYMKGKGTGYIRISFYDREGKKMKVTRRAGQGAGENWQCMPLRFTVPAQAASLEFSLETLRNQANVLFDDASLVLESGDQLENSQVAVKINRRLGGGIDSFFWKTKKVEFTSGSTFSARSGFMDWVLPAKRSPGVLGNAPFTPVKETSPLKRSYRTRLSGGAFDGLELIRTYELAPDAPKLLVCDTFTNTSGKPLEISSRLRNHISSAKGTYSYPTPDWVTLCHQAPGPRNGLTSLSFNLFRAGWLAKRYEKEDAALVFRFKADAISKIYTFFSAEPELSTMEWYYQNIKLAPGASEVRRSEIEIIPAAGPWYTDAYGKKQKTETIRPVKMPAPPAGKTVPPQFENYFTYCGTLGNLSLPELTGDRKMYRFPQRFAVLSDRQIAELADAYVNTISSGRLCVNNINEACFQADGRHLIGEAARRMGMRIILCSLFLNRRDVDVQDYMAKRWPRFKKMLEDTLLQRFIRNYSDLIPAFFTADEILAQNADVMLRVHQELKPYIPAGVTCIPYLNSSSTDLLPYLPIFIGDYYPVKRKNASGRNPWAVWKEFSALVKKAGNTPVWFMPQGFASSGGYAFPSPGELRLMLYLAAAAGVRGIAWHGFPSGTWPWMINYHMYRYSMLGAGCQHSPSWTAVREAGRFFAVTGPLLVHARPAALPQNVSLECGHYVSGNRFYDGPAVRLYALKHPDGMIYLAVNQNPYAPEKAVVKLPAAGWDIPMLTRTGREIPVVLQPGDCRAFFIGPDQALDPAFKSLFRAERARYLLLSDKLKGDGIILPDPDTFAKLPPLESVKALLKARKDAETKFASSPAGAAAAKFDHCRKLLEKTDFRLCCAMDAVVTPEMIKKTGRYRAWSAHPDPEFNALRKHFASSFADFYRLFDLIRKGDGVRKHEKEIDALLADLRETTGKIDRWLDRHKDRVEDPYEGEFDWRNADGAGL